MWGRGPTSHGGSGFVNVVLVVVVVVVLCGVRAPWDRVLEHSYSMDGVRK